MKESREILFAGVDPGTTTAAALVRPDGEVAGMLSGKNIDMGSLIARLASLGSVLVVGTDKAKTPAFVEQLAVKLGAKIYHPPNDLKVQDKKALARGLQTKNDHERDALAAALYALREHKPLLRKIDVFCEQERKEKLKPEITRLVFRSDVSLAEAARILEKPVPTPKREERRSPPPMNPKTVEEMRERIKRLEKDVTLVRKHNEELRKEFDEKKGSRKVIKRVGGKEALALRDKTITNLRKQVAGLQRSRDLTKKELERLNGFLLKLRDHYLLKKLDTLGSQTFRQQAGGLDLREGDLLLVEDPSTLSASVVETLKKKVSVIVTRRPVSRKLREELPFIVVDAAGLHLEETSSFAIVQKEQIDRQTRSSEALRKVISDYKKERSSRHLSWS